MRLLKWNTNVSNRQLTQFGWLMCFALPIMGWLWSAPTWFMVVLCGLGIVTAGIGWSAPRYLKPMFLSLMVVTFPIGLFVGEVLMLFVFVLVMVPIGLWFRLRNRDGLQRTFDHSADTYWQEKAEPKGPASYYRQW